MTKLTQLGNATAFEPAGDKPLGERQRAPSEQSHNLANCISSVSTARGPKNILKTLLTSACERNCNYCPFRAGRSQTKRITFSPDELAKGFDTLQHNGQVDGLFLSSGIIKGGVRTQDRIINTFPTTFCTAQRTKKWYFLFIR